MKGFGGVGLEGGWSWVLSGKQGCEKEIVSLLCVRVQIYILFFFVVEVRQQAAVWTEMFEGFFSCHRSFQAVSWVASWDHKACFQITQTVKHLKKCSFSFSCSVLHNRKSHPGCLLLKLNVWVVSRLLKQTLKVHLSQNHFSLRHWGLDSLDLSISPVFGYWDTSSILNNHQYLSGGNCI